MDKYQNKYRINSTRLQNWDYGWPASYFITICTKQHICYFAHIPQTPGQKRFQNQGRNTVSSIIGAYKSAVTRNIHLMRFEFQWQERFWDHVIRDKNEFERIRKYIIDNPVKWGDDDFFKR